MSFLKYSIDVDAIQGAYISFSDILVGMKKGSMKPKKQKKQKRSNTSSSTEDKEEVVADTEQLVNITELTEEMENALAHMQKEFIKSVTLRPSAGERYPRYVRKAFIYSNSHSQIDQSLAILYHLISKTVVSC